MLLTSANSGAGVGGWTASIATRRSVFVDHSGVGRSTRLDRLDPGTVHPAARVREKDQRGRHTTTANRSRRLANGPPPIDTPGVRVFELDPAYALAAVPDIANPGAGCRLRDRSHLHETR